MKAIKECCWYVVIDSLHKEFGWIAQCSGDSGLAEIITCKSSKNEEDAKKSWELFAKLNEIKNWEYVKE